MNSETDQIKYNSKKFRQGVKSCPKNLLSIAFQDFPKGSCGDASLLLAKYLEYHSIKDLEYVSGEFYEPDGRYQSHAWLQKGNLIIDITLDQFDDRSERVFVGTDNSWHEKFLIKHRRPAEFDADHLYLDYKWVTAWLEKAENEV